jgi:hypothetical protein
LSWKLDECEPLLAGDGAAADELGELLPEPGRGVIENKHSSDIGASLTLRFNAHTMRA